MGRPPVAAGALALLDDLLDGCVRGPQVRHSHQFRPVKQLGSRLRARRPDEHGAFPQPVDEMAEALTDAPVEMSHSREILHSRQRLARLDGLMRRCARNEAHGVLAFHSLGPLQVQEMGEGRVAERQQIK